MVMDPTGIESLIKKTAKNFIPISLKKLRLNVQIP